jgi:3-(3-hydroxy-phenyl)propionate hydroxylase
MTSSDRVVIVGAGPTGLAVALGLQLQGIPTFVLESEPALTRDLRAGSFHPPTVEVLDTLGVGQKFRDIGIVVPQWQIRDRKEGVVAQFDLGLLKDETPYPYRLHCEQFKLTPILYDALLAAGGTVTFSTAFTGFTQDGDTVTAEADGPNGKERFVGRYLVGCDGGRSAVRKAMGVAFEGFTWPERFLVVSMTEDLSRHGYTGNAYIADPVEWVAIFVMPHLGPPGLWRVVFPTDMNLAEEVVTSPAFCQERLAGFHPQGAPFEIPYVGTYRVHQRVASDFRNGRVLLAGDAAHVNNPLGAMGLNSGLHDAGNLIAKLAQVYKRTADASLLDRYVRQRRQTNIEYVQAISIRNKQLLEERAPAIRRQRLDELRVLAADPVRAKEHLMRSSMIASVRRAAAIE